MSRREQLEEFMKRGLKFVKRKNGHCPVATHYLQHTVRSGSRISLTFSHLSSRHLNFRKETAAASPFSI